MPYFQKPLPHLRLKGKSAKYAIQIRTKYVWILGSPSLKDRNARHMSIPCMYLTTLTLRPCLEMVVSTSPALLLQGRLWGGHHEVMALNSSWRSSFWASSSAGDTNVQSFTRICERTKQGLYSCRQHYTPWRPWLKLLLLTFQLHFKFYTWTKTFCRSALRSAGASSCWVWPWLGVFSWMGVGGGGGGGWVVGPTGASVMWGRSKNR